MLRWPRHHSNTAAVLVLGFQSVHSRILARRLGFLQHVADGGTDSVSGRVLESKRGRVSDL